VKAGNLTHMRAWEMNADGTRSGLAFTARDLNRHEPLRGVHRTGIVIDDRPSGPMLNVYGGLADRDDLFDPRYTYGIEMWVPLRHAGTPDTERPTQWAYFVLPRARVDEHTDYTDPGGTNHPAVTFTLSAGHQWGPGPHPVHWFDTGDTLEPAYLNTLATIYAYAYMTTTMAPSTAFQYTDAITHRPATPKGPTP
jgi:hypothetical protein